MLDEESEASASVANLPDRIRSLGGEGAIIGMCIAQEQQRIRPG